MKTKTNNRIYTIVLLCMLLISINIYNIKQENKIFKKEIIRLTKEVWDNTSEINRVQHSHIRFINNIDSIWLTSAVEIEQEYNYSWELQK